VPYTPTTFLNGGPPAISDTELNKLGNGIAGLWSTLPSINVKDYGAVGDGVTNDTAAIQAALTAAATSNGIRTVVFPAHTSGQGYRITASLSVANRGLNLVGQSRARGTSILSEVAGPLFTNGSDNALPWDGAYYDGVQSIYLRDLALTAVGGVTALANGTGNYLAGSIGLADWRGGDVQLERVTFQGFEQGFFGVQSDVNRWTAVEFAGCKTGAYLGPRCDQLTAVACYAFNCDRALDLDRVSGHRYIGCQFVGNGTDTINPIRVRSAWATGSSEIVFESCWFEHFQGFSTAAVEAFIEVGVGDSVTSNGVHVLNPTIATNITPTNPRARYLIKADRGDDLSIVNPGGQFWKNLERAINFVGTTSPSVLLQARNALGSNALTTTNSGSGSPSVTILQWGALGTSGGFTVGGGGVTAGAGLFSGRTTAGLATQTLSSNGGVTVNAQSANWHLVTLQANATSTTITNVPASNTSVPLTIAYRQDATGGRTYAWPANCKFAAASAPSDTTASRTTSVTFVYDGSNWVETHRAVAVG
jgi:hypothetical protein